MQLECGVCGCKQWVESKDRKREISKLRRLIQQHEIVLQLLSKSPTARIDAAWHLGEFKLAKTKQLKKAVDET